MRPPRQRFRPEPPIEMVVIGCSLGGMFAMQRILERIPPAVRVPMALAQHRHRDSTDALSEVLQRSTHYHVADAEDSEPIVHGRLYLAPPDYHLLVEEDSFRLSTEGAVQFSRPSIDVLFETAADSFRDRLLGVLLTGANRDGMAGALRIRERSGTVIVQDPATAEAPSMPQAAIAAGAASRVFTLDQIAEYVTTRCPA